MEYPSFTNGQFVDAAILNGGTDLLQSGIEDIGANLHTPGLVDAPGFVITTNSTLQVSVAISGTSYVLFGNGELGGGYGTTNGETSNSYTVDFTHLVPASGSITAYLVASAAIISQSPYTVVGPPIGHPDYNPNFTSYTAYNQSQISLTLSGSSTVPDNSVYVEIGRVTLLAGQSSITAIDTSHQILAGAILDDTGVPAGNYGSSTTIPVLNVGADGRINSASSEQSTVVTFSGNPNSNIAGTLNELCYDTTDNLFWMCTTAGTSSTAVWTWVSGGIGSFETAIGVAGTVALTSANSGQFISWDGNGTLTLPQGSTCAKGNVIAVHKYAENLGTVAAYAGDFIGTPKGNFSSVYPGSDICWMIFIRDSQTNLWQLAYGDFALVYSDVLSALFPFSYSVVGGGTASVSFTAPRNCVVFGIGLGNSAGGMGFSASGATQVFAFSSSVLNNVGNQQFSGMAIWTAVGGSAVTLSFGSGSQNAALQIIVVPG